MDRWITHEDKADVVYNLHWDCLAEQDGVSHRAYGTQVLDVGDLSNFTAYGALTEEQVMTWLSEVIDVESVEDECRDGLEKKLNPTILKGLPWGNADGEEE
jgi:hypothetical protein